MRFIMICYLIIQMFLLVAFAKVSSNCIGSVGNEESYFNFLKIGERHLGLNEYEKANSCFLKASDKFPQRFEAWHYLTRLHIHHQKPWTKKGLKYFTNLINLNPDKDLLNDYGIVCRYLQDECAVTAYKKLVELEPDNWLNRIYYVYVLNPIPGKEEELFIHTKEFLRLFFQIKYDDILEKDLLTYKVYFKDALVVYSKKKTDSLYFPEIKLLFEKGIVFWNSDNEILAQLYGLIGAASNAISSHLDAISYLTKARSYDPFELQYPFEIGKAYSVIGETQKSSEYPNCSSFEIAANLPGREGQQKELIYYSLSMTLRFQGEIEKSFLYSEKAYNLDPASPMLLGEYSHNILALCYWDKYNQLYPRIEQALLARIYLGFPSDLMLALTTLDAEKYVKPKEQQFQHNPDKFKQDITCNSRKLKIAYISSNFRNHAQGTQMSSYFKEHDRNKFEVYAFSLVRASTPEAIDRQKILKPQFDHWIEVESLTDYKLAEKINSYQIDIAIDLCGLADLPQLSSYSYRPAPVQISFLGYPGTTGANFIDYYVADNISVPPSLFPHFSEKLILLPNSYQVTEHKQDYPIREDIYQSYLNSNPQELSGVSDNTIIFANFNQPIKISQEIFHVWMNLLKRVDNSILWLATEKAKQGVKDEALKLGVDPNRIKFLRSIPKEIHVYRLKRATILLDTDRYNAHTSAGDALWSGLPIVTILGNTMPGRVCASMIDSFGLYDELVTHSLKEYEERAYSLATNQTRLEKIKKILMENKNSVSLFDTKLFVKNFEKALVKTWDVFLNNSKPETFYVKDIR